MIKYRKNQTIIESLSNEYIRKENNQINIFLQFIFIFYMGCTLGWVLELFFRRIVHGKWVNPGFLIGPYLPIIDYVYSSQLYSKIKQYAKENNITVKYEQLKMHIKDEQAKRREKYSFINPFNQTKPLKNYLLNYKKENK